VRFTAHPSEEKPVQGLHPPCAGFFVLQFKRSWSVNGVPTNPTSVTIGILDLTAGLQVVPNGTAMPNALDGSGNPITGQFEYDLSSALPEHAYQATSIVTFMGQTFTKVDVAAAEAPRHLTHEPLAHHLTRAIAENAAGAQSVSSAAGSLTAHSLLDQIAADQYLSAKAAVNSPGGALGALRTRKMIPPSSIGAQIGGGP